MFQRSVSKAVCMLAGSWQEVCMLAGSWQEVAVSTIYVTILLVSAINWWLLVTQIDWSINYSFIMQSPALVQTEPDVCTA